MKLSLDEEAKLKIGFISDTHELHRSVDLPLCDFLIHAGDWTFFSKSRKQIDDFNDWLGEQYAPLGRILSPGNHETYLEHDRHLVSLTSNGTVLIEEQLAVRGLNLWASPITPHSVGGFAVANAEDRARRYAKIPLNTDILITHGPPFGILDCGPGELEHQGCRELLAAVMRVKPKIHVFGHVHSGYGVYQTPDTLFVNAALLGADGDVDRPPIVITIEEL